MGKPILVLDFDGVLCNNDLPVEGAQWAVTLYKQYFRVIVHSARFSHAGGIEAARQWLHKHRFPPLELSPFKPVAQVSLDDRALTFSGTWPDVTVLLSFQPWNKE